MSLRGKSAHGFMFWRRVHTGCRILQESGFPIQIGNMSRLFPSTIGGAACWGALGWFLGIHVLVFFDPWWTGGNYSVDPKWTGGKLPCDFVHICRESSGTPGDAIPVVEVTTTPWWTLENLYVFILWDVRPTSYDFMVSNSLYSVYIYILIYVLLLILFVYVFPFLLFLFSFCGFYCSLSIFWFVYFPCFLFRFYSHL